MFLYPDQNLPTDYPSIKQIKKTEQYHFVWLASDRITQVKVNAVILLIFLHQNLKNKRNPQQSLSF